MTMKHPQHAKWPQLVTLAKRLLPSLSLLACTGAAAALPPLRPRRRQCSRTEGPHAASQSSASPRFVKRRR